MVFFYLDNVNYNVEYEAKITKTRKNKRFSFSVRRAMVLMIKLRHN